MTIPEQILDKVLEIACRRYKPLDTQPRLCDIGGATTLGAVAVTNQDGPFEMSQVFEGCRKLPKTKTAAK